MNDTKASDTNASRIARKLKAAQRVSVPLVAIASPDPAHTVQTAAAVLNGQAPKVQWDMINGLTGLNASGEELVNALGGSDATVDGGAVGILVTAKRFPDNTVLFMHMGSAFLEQPPFVQALWNLRDLFKQNHRMVVLLGPSFRLPEYLGNDVLVLDEPLPSAEEMAQIVGDTIADAGAPATEDDVSRAVEAVLGIPAFPAEQAVAMSLTKEGVDTDEVWERKRKQIEQSPALRVCRDGDRFEDIGGYDNVKSFVRRIISGPGRPNAIIVIEEIEKALAGMTGDTSGTTQDQLAVLLTYMQEKSASGAIFIGPPGSGKSQVAKAIGNEAGVPTIYLDLGAAKGSLVGLSEQNIRLALKVISAVSNDKMVFVGTCNSIGVLPPELRRRFTLGTFFFDLPSAEERNRIWSLYVSKFGLKMSEVLDKPNDAGWTGAEIRTCCWLAYLMNCSLTEAARYIVPVIRSAAEQIDKLRSQANGRFISASYPGEFRKDGPEASQDATLKGRRKVEIG